jgi:hypothetical protein
MLRSVNFARHLRSMKKPSARMWDSLKNQWLILVLASLFVVSAVLGVEFYNSAAPPKIGLESLPAPGAVDVFVSDPSARASLTVQVSSSTPPPMPGQAPDSAQWMATIFLRVVPSSPSERVRWIVEFENVNGAGSSADRLPVVYPPTRSPSTIQIFEGASGRGIVNPKNPEGSSLGEFLNRSVQISRGDLVVRMPELAPSSALSPLEAGVPIIGVEDQATGGVPAPPVFSPGGTLTNEGLVYPDYLGHFPDLPKGKVLTKYYMPQAIATTDQLNVPLADYQTLSNYPSNSSLTPGGVTWQSAGELSPALTAEEDGLSESRADRDFIAGVFLAIAAATLIALLQELNGMQRRRREDSPAGGGPSEEPSDPEAPIAAPEP